MFRQRGNGVFFQGIVVVAWASRGTVVCGGVIFFCLFFIIFFYGIEVGVFPDVFAHEGFIYGGGVDDDIMGVRIESCAA